MDDIPVPHRFIPPPPPSYESPPTIPWYPPPPSSDEGGIIIFLVVAFALSLLGFFLCGALRDHRESRARAEAEAAAAAAARLPSRSWPRALPRLEPTRHFEELRLRQARAANPAARLPAFKYSQSVKHNVTGSAEEAATCSVCLGVFQLGETVRLLPVCLHLYHADCIDPWLDAHSTCPICRSDTHPMMDVARLPHVQFSSGEGAYIRQA